MPVSTDCGQPPAKRCKHCDESTHGLDGPGLWRLTLDQDLLDTLSRRFPTWFDGASSSGVSSIDSCASDSPSPPKSEGSTVGFGADGHSDLGAGHHLTGSVGSVDGGFVSSASTGSPTGTADSAICASAGCCGDEDDGDDHVHDHDEDEVRPDVESGTEEEEEEEEEDDDDDSEEDSDTDDDPQPDEPLPPPPLAIQTQLHSSLLAPSRSDLLFTDFFSSTSEQFFTVDLVDFNGMADGKFGPPLVTSSSGQALKEVWLLSGADGLQLNASPSGGHSVIGVEDVFINGAHPANGVHTSSPAINTSLLNNNTHAINANLSPPSNVVSNALTNAVVCGRQQSPPKAVVDSSPLQPAMDRNKESLKVKLMVRRPINQLVEQGIIPPLKNSPALHEQRKNLERAKTGDLLRAKIQQRPDRQELERRHILEHEDCHVDPSLAEKQRKLKKARLADQLNCQIIKRPGPLELIKKNILHTEEPIERIVKEGLVSFKATSEGLLNRPQQPNSYKIDEDDSQSSEGDLRNTPPRSEGLEPAQPPATPITLTIPSTPPGLVLSTQPHTNALKPQQQLHPFLTSGGSLIVPKPLISTTASSTYVPPPPPPPPPVPFRIEPIPSNISFKSDPNLFFEKPDSSTSQTVPSPFPQSSTQLFIQKPLPSLQTPKLGKHRLKCKKSQSKTRPIKFHEYKGPPSAQKSSSSLASVNEETSYQLLLKQQNFLLEYLEGLHKHPTNILPANLKALQAEVNSFQQSTTNFMLQPSNSPPPPLSVASSIPASPAPSVTDSISSELSKLEKMKVSDLKLLLKKRNLPVSGPKPHLIERLRPYLPLEPSDSSQTESIAGDPCDMESMNSPHATLSPESSEQDSLMDVQQMDSPSPLGRATPHQFHLTNITHSQHHHNDEKLREQQRKIEELKRKLRESQEELMQMKQTTTQPPPLINSESGSIVRPDPTPPPQAPQPVINQKLVFKQQLEAKIQKDKMMQLENQQRQQRQHAAFQQAKLQAANNLHRTTTNTISHPVIISNKEDKPALAFNNNPPLQLTQKKPVEFMWNGEQTLFLVGLPDNKRIITTTTGIPPKTNTMPGILVPISSGPHQHQHHQPQHIILTAPQPPPPPLDPISNIKVELKPVISSMNLQSPPKLYHPHTQQQPIVADRPIKIEFTPAPPLAYETTNIPSRTITKPPTTRQPKTEPIKKPTAKSQVMTDVLEILIKNGELPETAVFDPTTPTTPVTINNNNNQPAAQNPLVFTSLIDSSPNPQLPTTTTPIPQLNHTNSESKLLLDANIDSIEMLSPMQPDCDNSVNSFDMFLEQQERKHAHETDEHMQQPLEPNQLETRLDGQNDQLSEQERQRLRLEEMNRANQMQSMQHQSATIPDQSNHIDLKPFEDLELMELMGHQLDMDMHEEPCHQYTLNNTMRLLNNDNNICADDGGSLKMNRCDPSLQPSLNELIMQQQQQQQNLNFANVFGGLCNNNNNDQHGTSDHGSLINSSTSLNNNSGGHLLGYNSTPMDIECFENSLSSFDLCQFTNNDQINTPPHPFGQQQPQQQQQPSGLGLQQHISQPGAMQHHHTDSMSSHDVYPAPLALNHENILDLFNIDDFKMTNDSSLSWNEVDFAA